MNRMPSHWSFPLLVGLLLLAFVVKTERGPTLAPGPFDAAAATDMQSQSRSQSQSRTGIPHAAPHETTATIDELSPITVGYPSSGVVLGQAYDYVGQRWLPSVCVDGGSSELGASEMNAKYSDLEDRHQVFDSLKISASGEGSVGLASASASVDYAKSIDIAAEKRNILATISAMKGGVQLTPPKGSASVVMVKEALDKAARAGSDGVDQFRAMCGDGYVAAIRRGARLSMVFSYALDSKEIKESMDVAASGSYGAAKGKASMDRLIADTSLAKRTQVNLLQVGGNRDESPIDAGQALTKLSKFGKFDPADATPLEVVILPYRILPGIPAALKTQTLPDLGVRGLTTHYWRLVDLSNLYARAYVNRTSYYSPFVAPDALASTARAAQHAASCVAKMLDICAVEGRKDNDNCSLNSLTERASVDAACSPTKATDREVAETLLFAFGKTYATDLLRRKAATLPHSKAALAILSAPGGTAKSATFSSRGQTSSSDSADTAWVNNVYDVWYHYYARAPWPRIVDDKGVPVDGDMTMLLNAYCKSRRLNCDNLNYALLSAENPKVDANKPQPGEVLRAFVTDMRLYPVAAVTCETLVMHPLCQLPDVLRGYVNEMVEGEQGPAFGPKRGFYPPTPPRLEPTPEPREPRGGPGFGFGGPCPTRPMNCI